MSEHHHPGHVGPLRALGAACLVILAALVCAALLAACGGSSGSASDGASGAAAPAASASASATIAGPIPEPSPLITSGPPPAAAVETVRAFWTLVGEGRLSEAQRSLVAPGSPMLQWNGEDIAAARFVRVVPGSVGRGPVEGATIEFSVIVWIDPGSQPSPWGEAGEHQLFEHVVRMSDGTWRMRDSGTGP